jgi:primosomal protein N' (replication factor Y)
VTEPAASPVHLPVAAVRVDTGLAHLDRPFDYAVPPEFAESAQPGVRVKVRFAGRDRDGFVVDRLASSDAGRALTPLRAVVSPERVLSPEVLALAESVAARYAGQTFDILRQAVPPRHARVEAEPEPPPAGVAAPPVPSRPASSWAAYEGGTELLDDVVAGRGSFASVTLRPDQGATWPLALAELAATALAAGRGAVLVVPDHRDVARLELACDQVLGAGRFVAMTADLGPAKRYRRFLAVSRGQVGVAIGTRSAAFAPVTNLGLVACFDDGDDLHVEPRAPGWHVREVLLRRAQQAGAVAVLAGYATSTERALLVEGGWAREVRPGRKALREASARVTIAGASDQQRERDPLAASSRIPREAMQVVRDGLVDGPVLVQVPRQGYALAVACADCHSRVVCPACGGPIAQARAAHGLACRWCGTGMPDFACASCGGTRLRAPMVGSSRTAEELGRAFPGVPVRISAADKVLASVGAERALVIATPGGEPVADEGYAAAVLVDGLLLLARADLRAEEEALRRWMAAAALVRPAGKGGRVLLVAPPDSRAAQALVAWDPDTFADRELAERRSSHLPPAARLATIDGDQQAVEAVATGLDRAGLPPGAELLGPVPVVATARSESAAPPVGEPPGELDVRLVVRVPPRSGAELASLLRQQQARRSAAKEDGAVRIRLDPVPLA